MSDRPSTPLRPACAFLALALVAAAVPNQTGAAYGPPGMPPPECESRLPQVLNMGLPYVEGVVLEELERSLRVVVGERYLESALCPARPLRVNVALGSDYQILDWLDRGLVDMAVVPVLGLHLLRRDGLDLIEVAAPGAGAMEQLVGRVPSLTLTWFEDGEPLERTGHAGDLARFAHALWRHAVDGLPAEGNEPGHLVMPSHLSTAGFLMPILTIEEALAEHPDAAAASAEDRRRFWSAFYDRVCFRFSARLGGRDGGVCAAGDGAPRLEVAVVEEATGDAALDAFGPPVLGQRLAYRDRLVVRRSAAASVFAPRAFPGVELPEWDELYRLEALLVRPGAGDGAALPTAFDGFLTPNGYFGTRTFAFRVGESLDLIELHQRISGRSGLSLVLPGGGVKAAYQSRVLDELYAPAGGASPRLRNAGAAPVADGVEAMAAAEPAAARPLRVDSVVGTSGGALLGFFVARLGPSGPGDLSSILWKPGAADGSERYLTASEIFGWTDLPRYISLVLVLGLFGLVLAPFSWRRSGFLSPENRPEETPWRAPSTRPALLVTLIGVLGLTPLLVRWVSGPVAEEHVPEFEGLLYAVLLVIAMFADQCLVRPPARERSAGAAARGRLVEAATSLGVPASLLLAGGALLVVTTLVVRLLPGGARFVEGEMTTGGAYASLALIAAGFGLVACRGRRMSARRWVNVALWLSDAVLGTVVAWIALRLAGEEMLAVVDRTPLLFLALFGAILVAAVVRLVQSEWSGPGNSHVRALYDAGKDLAAAAIGHRGARFLAARAVSFLGCLIALDLTRPEAAIFAATPIEEVFFTTSKLHAPRGAIAVCLGAILLLLGVVLVLHQRRNRYRLERHDRFRDALLLVVTGLALAVYLVLVIAVWAVSKLDAVGWFAGSGWFARLAELTLFELTPSFWVGLTLASLLGSLALVRWAWVGCRRGTGLANWVCHSLAYLCAVHPNAHIVPRRVVRLGLIAAGGLVWWNFLLAPALYGNRYAYEYLEAADARFESAFCRSHLSAERCRDVSAAATSYRLTARYLAPANALSVDGTRFVLAVADGEACPAVPSSPGVTWRRFRAVGDGTAPKDDGCTDLRLADDRQRRVLQDYIFASGSPFPAFPPRRVPVYEGARIEETSVLEALVDGGYSNNVPLEAAAKIGARQALVVHSSHPGPVPSEEGWFSALAGPLVDNLPRVLGFLYERSQQLDRRSRSDLFVVSLAPPPADDWPLLTDFRASTVKRMIQQAEKGLERRIGLVESWGPPEFQTSLRVPEEDRVPL